MAIHTMNPGDLNASSPRGLTPVLIAWAPLLAFPLGLLLGALSVITQPAPIGVSHDATKLSALE